MFPQGRAARTLGPRQLPAAAADVLLRHAARPPALSPCVFFFSSRDQVTTGGDPRKRRGGAGARHQYLPLEDAGGGDQRALTAVSGVFFAFYYNNLFPEQIFT